VIKLGAKWGETTLELPEGRWNNAFTDETLNGGEIAVAKLLHRFPVALLLPGRHFMKYLLQTISQKENVID